MGVKHSDGEDGHVIIGSSCQPHPLGTNTLPFPKVSLGTVPLCILARDFPQRGVEAVSLAHVFFLPEKIGS